MAATFDARGFDKITAIRGANLFSQGWAIAMEEGGIQDVQSRARILLICPDCGHENSEMADVLRGAGTFYCRGDDCDYIFDLMPGRRDYGRSFVEACKRFYAVLHAPRRQGVR